MMLQPSKVLGNPWHMDFLALTENHILPDFDMKNFLIQIFFSWELALIHTIIVHNKFNFYHSNPNSLEPFFQGGYSPYFPPIETNCPHEAWVLTLAPDFMYYLVSLDRWPRWG